VGIADIQVGGLERAFAISDILAITVLIPLPFPSTYTDAFSTIHQLATMLHPSQELFLTTTGHLHSKLKTTYLKFWHVYYVAHSSCFHECTSIEAYIYINRQHKLSKTNRLQL